MKYKLEKYYFDKLIEPRFTAWGIHFNAITHMLKNNRLFIVTEYAKTTIAQEEYLWLDASKFLNKGEKDVILTEKIDEIVDRKFSMLHYLLCCQALDS